MSRAVVIAAAPNGARLQKSDHPGVPLTKSEIVECCAACVDCGATLLHVHVRDADGRHLLDAGEARHLEAAIIAAVGRSAVVQTTTESFGTYSAREQINFLKSARPEAASVAWRELSRPEVTMSDCAELLTWCNTERVGIQYILYDLADIQSFQRAMKRGVIPESRPNILLVVGRYQSVVPADARALMTFLPLGFPVSSWMICAFGAAGYEVLHSAALLHGHVRIGFENGTILPDGRTAPDNAALVRSMREAVEYLGLRGASAEECRAVFLPG